MSIGGYCTCQSIDTAGRILHAIGCPFSVVSVPPEMYTPSEAAIISGNAIALMAKQLATKDVTIARLEAEVAKWEASANATHKAASDNAARASKAEADNRRLRLALTAAADALEGEGVFHCDHPNGYCPRCFAARDAAREAAKEEV